MPRRCEVDPSLRWRIDAQDRVVTAAQALAAGLTRRSIDHRIASGAWQRLLPGVLLTHSGHSSRRQLLVAALLWAGPESALDGVDACRFHGLGPAAAEADLVRIVVPWEHWARSRGFVRIRRTTTMPAVVSTDRLHVVAAADAVVAAGRTMRSPRAITALYSDALQQRVITVDELIDAHRRGSGRGRRRADPALAAVAGGALSVPEADALRLLRSSSRLPTPLPNALLRLPCGRTVSPDALLVDSGIVHEVNGRRYHAREDRFDHMQERHDAMTAAGLIVLHNSPRRLRDCPAAVLMEVERTHARYAGRGLPAGVVVVTPPASSARRRP